jgi:hypothetical protein
MPHTQWVARQKKLEIPNDKDEVNKQDIRDCDGRAHDQKQMLFPGYRTIGRDFFFFFFFFFRKTNWRSKTFGAIQSHTSMVSQGVRLRACNRYVGI